MSCWTEFQPLEEVIVGKPYSKEALANFQDPELKGMLSKIFDETEEDCLKLCDFLKSVGVTVKRPEILFDLEKNYDQNGKYRPRVDLHKFGFSYPNQPLMPRDTVGIYGNTIVEFFTRSPGRYFENWHYQSILMDYYKEGHRWISMPQPILDESVTEYYQYEDKAALFHAANLLKCGKDIFYTQPKTRTQHGRGNIHGEEWIKRELGNEFRLNPIPAGGHADGKLALLKPGVLMCWDESHVPEKLKSWEKIIVPQTWSKLPDEFQHAVKKRWFKGFIEEYSVNWINYCDSTIFDVNCFSVSEELVIVNGYNAEIFDKLKKQNIEAYPIHLRHQHFWDGAMHCITLDTKRKGEQVDYFS
jgi:glycine amidinotransferase